MKKILITGGNSGIGRAIANTMAHEGNSIYITGRDETKLQNVVEELKAKGVDAFYGVADVRDPVRANEIIADAIDKMNGLNVLVANAGVGRFKELHEFTDEDFELQFDVNVKGVFNYVRPSIKHMRKEDNGQIVVTSSNLGFTTSARCGIYAATKYALQGMIGALREELKGTGVKAGTINPGSVDTPWFDGKVDDPERREKMLDPYNVADAAKLMINQGRRSDIDHILVHPGIQ